MNLEETIYKRQSIRSYKQENLDENIINQLKTFIENAKTLNETIKWSYDIVDSEEISTMLRWKAPHYLLLFSEKKENYKENIGFIFQQVDLYLQSKGIGTCWLGMVKPGKNYIQKEEKQSYIIAISFGKTQQEIYRKIEDFQRKPLKEITDKEDNKLKAIKYAPSAVNSQPWYITHEKDEYNIYRRKFGILKRKTVEKWNKIDIGIALAHIYIENKETFQFYSKENPKKLDNHYYEGSFKI